VNKYSYMEQDTWMSEHHNTDYEYVIVDQHDVCLGYAGDMQHASDMVGSETNFRLISHEEFIDTLLRNFLEEKVIEMTHPDIPALCEDVQEIIIQAVAAGDFLNDTNTRDMIQYALGSYFTDMDICHYYITCDNRNNTPETIDNHSLIVDIDLSYPSLSLNIVMGPSLSLNIVMGVGQNEPETDYLAITRDIANG
jgi:hypothetical protein